MLPYALSRSSLRGPLGEQALAGPEHIMLNYVVRRVTLGNQVGPYYPNGPDGPTRNTGIARHREQFSTHSSWLTTTHKPAT